MRRVLPWLAGAVVLTALFGSLYIALQQGERLGADDAPARLASQVASELRGGYRSALSPRTVDLSSSLAAFVIVYDSGDRPVSGNGELDGRLASVPRGVLDDTRRDRSVHHVTWQPGPGLRFSTVEVAVGQRVVLAGQSLAPTEARIDSLGLLIAAGWAGTMVLGAAFWLLWWLFGRWEPVGRSVP
ncbi:hypothetical protein [Lacisediminihabitans profunda]|uniref:Two-component sensor histidine kinase n=1 Tax=Lacisediminihabitans profunda TaxID=2594790 RepID=A0A5C8UXQ8_9MICO|nr:hypothetical protein [Lacisediminihabitans profunda]TXN32472.1 hypothetical protein FVP33_02390 [Lacisediminihabitans profunda]